MDLELAGQVVLVTGARGPEVAAHALRRAADRENEGGAQVERGEDSVEGYHV